MASLRKAGRALIMAAQGLALVGLGACATGRGYSIASSAPVLADEQVDQSSDVSDQGSDRRGRFRRFYFRREGDGSLVAAAAPAGNSGFTPVSLSPTGPAANNGLLYLAGNLLPTTGLASPLNGLAGGTGSLLQSAVATSAGGVAGIAGGTVNAVNQTGLVNASLGSNGAVVGAGSGSGSGSGAVAVSVTPAAGGLTTGVAAGGTGASVSTGVTGGGASVGLAGSLGGVAGGGLSVGLGRTAGGGLVSVNTSSTNSNLLKGR